MEGLQIWHGSTEENGEEVILDLIPLPKGPARFGGVKQILGMEGGLNIQAKLGGAGAIETAAKEKERIRKPQAGSLIHLYVEGDRRRPSLNSVTRAPGGVIPWPGAE